MAQGNRAVTVATWVLSVLLFVLFSVVAGPGKVLGHAEAVEGFRKFGYSDSFRVLIGALETVGGVTLLLPAVAGYGASMLACVMVGATYTHLRAQESLLVPLVVLVLLLGVAWVRRPAFARTRPDPAPAD